MKVNYLPSKNTSFMPQLPATEMPNTPLPTIAPYTSLGPIERQQALAKEILGEGIDSSPTVGGWGEGLARMGKALIGGILQNKADERLKTAKEGNRQNVLGSFESGDLGGLITSEDPVAQKLGAALIEQKMKKKSGSYKTLPDKTVVWQDEEGGAPTVISRQHPPLIREGMISNDEGLTWDNIPDYNKNAKALADAKRAPKVVKPDESGELPWKRKW